MSQILSTSKKGEGGSVSYMHIGDQVYLYAEGRVTGFVSTLGLVDDRVVVQPDAGDLTKPPAKFRDCIFKILPMQHYSAKEQYIKATQNTHTKSMPDTVTLQEPGSVVDQEKKQSLIGKTEKQWGAPVQYGTTIIQLLHVKSNTFLMVVKGLLALVERCSMRVSLDVQGSEATWFYVQPVYKFRTSGENVYIGDKVILMPVNAGQPLHVSDLSLLDRPDCREVNADPAGTNWKISLFMEYKEDSNDILKEGDVVRLFHMKQEKFLTVDHWKDNMYVFLRTTAARGKKTDTTSSKALWEVEVVNHDPCRSGTGHWNNWYRFKHLATGLHLAAEVDHDTTYDPMRQKLRGITDNVYHLTVAMCSTKPMFTIFDLMSTTTSRTDQMVLRNSYVHLRHIRTSTWVHATSIPIDKDTDKPPVMHKVGLASKREDSEVFAIVPVTGQEVRGLEFASDASKAIGKIASKMKDGLNVTPDEIKSITTLLEDVVFFVILKENIEGQRRDALTEEGIPDRERQELLREQCVLKQIFKLLAVPLKTNSGKPLFKMEDLTEKKYEAIQYIFQLCYKIIQHSQFNYKKNKAEITNKFLRTMRSQIGYGVLAEDTIAALENNNSKSDAQYFGAAYLRFIGTKESLDLLFLKLLFFGPPRLGKTTVRHRLMGEIVDLKTAGEDDSAQPSTGAVESENVIVRSVSCSTAMVAQSQWSSVEDLNDEVHMLFHNLMDTIAGVSRKSVRPVQSEVISTRELPTISETEMKSSLPASSSNLQVGEIVTEPTPAVPSQASREIQGTSLEQEAPEILAMLHEAMGSKYWKDIKQMFKTYLRVEDTGGQPELMDMLPALTIGPGLYLLFVNLQNDLDQYYKLTYCDKSGTSTPPVESVYTVKELLLTCLSSISCSNASLSTSCLDGKESSNISNVEDILKSSQSVAYIVGTHKDKVSEQQIKKLNEELIKVIETTDFYKKGIIKFYSKEELIVTLDNLKGGTHEINLVKDMLEKIMERHFKKLRVPAVWLIFSLLLRRRKKHTASLAGCMGLSASLNMTHGETEVALWFLHHHAGVLMYFPDISELKDLIIIDVQVVYDSVTILILRAMDWEEVGHYNAQKFGKTGKFTVGQLTAITSKVSGDFIPIGKLVVLLEYLHIIARISSHQQTSSTSKEEVTYIMPCVLDSANKEELDTISKKFQEVCPIMVRFKCGFVPIGIFPAVIACLINNQSFTVIEEGIKKNAVQFRYGVHRTSVSFVCRPMYYSFIVSQFFIPKVELHKECSALRKEIEASFDQVCSRMNYGALMEYEFAFACPIHTECGHDHLCVVNREESSPVMMDCLLNMEDRIPVHLNDQHKLWYGESMSNANVSSAQEEPLASTHQISSISLSQSEPECSGTKTSYTQGEDNVKLLKKEIPILVEAIHHSIDSVGDSCYGEDLISDDTYDHLQLQGVTDRKKARKLLMNVKEVISQDPETLMKFLDVLREKSLCDTIVTKIQKSLQH